MGSKIIGVIIEELIQHFNNNGKFNKSIWINVTSNINERFEGIREYNNSEIIDLFYKNIAPVFPDICNYGVTDVEMTKKFMILKNCPHTLEEFNDDISDEYEEGMEEFVSNIIHSFYSRKN
ncbi:unnamed protein product [Diamesa hyperborea]